MIKLIIAGVWVCLVTLASTYAAVSWQTAPRAAEHESAQKGHGGGAEAAKGGHGGSTESVKSRMISVPVIIDGAVQGYVMAQFIFVVDAKAMKQMSVKPDLFLLDEAFKTIYAGDVGDFRKLKKQDLGALSKDIAENANKRLGVRIVEDVLIQELNYIPKDRVRG
jgi:hypothetical protein